MNMRRLVCLHGLFSLLFACNVTWGQTGGVVIEPVTPAEELTLPEQPRAEMFPIPPVIDRPIGEEEGDRLFVSEFQLKGVTDRPQLDLEELRRIIEKARMEGQGLTTVGEDGFTEEERMQIASFMRAVVDDPDWDNRLAEYEALVDRLREEKSDRRAGMTIGQIQNVANAVTEYYRRAGYVLAQAYIPAQEVSDGLVSIEVIEGTLGSVLAEGNKTYSDKLLAAPFKDLIDAPITASEIEAALLTLGDIPGLSVFGVFQPGQTVGTTDMVVRVQDEDPWDATVRYDNHGSRFTGDNRLFASFTLNNPTRAGDRITASGLQQYNPKKGFFGSVEYERPMFIPGLTGIAQYSRNFFDLGAELRDNNLGGVVKEGSLHFRQTLLRSRARNLYAQAGVNRAQLFNKQNRVTIAKDDISTLDASVSYDSINPETASVHLASLGFTVGLDDWLGGMGGQDDVIRRALPPSRVSESGKFATNVFHKVNAEYTRLQTFNTPGFAWLGDYLTENVSALIRVNGQWSRHLLPPTEQYSIGGPTNVRAYPPSEFLVDDALFASVEFTADAPGFADVASPFRNLNWGQILHVSFFADYAFGARKAQPLQGGSGTQGEINSNETTVTVAGLGFGLRFSLPGEFTGRLQAAQPIGERQPSDRDATHWWFDFTYDF